MLICGQGEFEQWQGTVWHLVPAPGEVSEVWGWEVMAQPSLPQQESSQFVERSRVGSTCLALSDGVMTGRSLNLAPKHWAASRDFCSASSLLPQQWFLLQAAIEKCMQKQSGSYLPQPCNWL